MTYVLPVLGVLCRVRVRGSGVAMPVCVATLALKAEDSTPIADALLELERRQLAWCVRDARGHITLAGATWLGRCVGHFHGLYGGNGPDAPTSGLNVALGIAEAHPHIRIKTDEVDPLVASRTR